MPEPWPDLSGEMPTDAFWSKRGRERWWIAAKAIGVDEATLAEAGAIVGRQPGTVSRWVQTMRARYGDEFLAPPEGRNRPDREAAALASELNGAGVAARWADLRTAAAHQNMQVAGLARTLAERHLARYLNDPDAPLLSVAELLMLARTAGLLETGAARLIGADGDASPGGDTPHQMGGVPEHLLDALNATPTDELEQVAELARASLHTFQLIRGDGEDETVVETRGDVVA